MSSWKERKAGESHPVDIHVGRRLAMLRNALGMSQTEVARGLGLSFQQVQKYERGFNRISASRLYEIAQLTGYPVAWFFEGLEQSEDVPPEMLLKPSEWQLLAKLRTLPEAARSAVAELIRRLPEG